MRAVFLFGAGASSFGGPCHPYEPPLGQGGGLLRALQKFSGVWAGLPRDLAAMLAQDFEAGMMEFQRSHEGLLVPALRDMGFYFLQFRPLPGQFYQTIIRTCREEKIAAVFATTNYETLIECSVEYDGGEVAYGFDDDTPGAVRVLKLHGSSNFVQTMPGLQGKIEVRGVKEYFGGGHVSAEWNAVAEQRLRANPSFPPVMSIYAPGKRVLGGSFAVKRQQEQFVDAVARAQRIYVVGLSVNPTSDPHILDPLGRSPAHLLYVAPDRRAFDKWSASDRLAKTSVTDTFKEAMPFIVSELRAHG